MKKEYPQQAPNRYGEDDEYPPLDHPRVAGVDERLVVALDFGTTYSGVAICSPHLQNKDPIAIMDWPGTIGPTDPKTPTIIRYNISDSTDYKWGNLAKATKNPSMGPTIVGIKLLLNPETQDKDKPSHWPTGITDEILNEANLPKPAIEVAADYIRAIFKHAEEMMTQHVPVSYLNTCKKEYVMSVPAAWSDKAKDATEKAAKTAGISDVTIIKEPEAAALFVLRKMKGALEIGDAFVLCDAGGGTVDLISYEIQAIYPTLKLKELVPGQCRMDGSLSLNWRFANEVKKLVGDDQWEWLKDHHAYQYAEKQWEMEVKRLYDGDENDGLFINFPRAKLTMRKQVNGFDGRSWEIPNFIMRRIFDPVVDSILAAISEQVDAARAKRSGRPVNGIFLVGGFSASNYLLKRVRSQFQKEVHQIYRPDKAWESIVRGAALSKLSSEVQITSRSALRHYGTAAWYPFNNILDAGQRTEADRDGSVRCLRMTWFISKGQQLDGTRRIAHDFYHDLPINFDFAKKLVFTCELRECGNDEAPRHKTDAVFTNCKVSVDLRSMDHSVWDRLYNSVDRKPYVRVWYELVVEVDNALMKWSAEVNGKKVGVVDVRY